MTRSISNPDQSPQPAGNFLSPCDQLDYMLEISPWETRGADKSKGRGSKEPGQIQSEVGVQSRSVQHLPDIEIDITCCLFRESQNNYYFREV